MKKSERYEFGGTQFVSESYSADSIPETITDDMIPPTETAETERLQDNAAGEDDSVTQPIGLYRGEELQAQRSVVGWLVCIKGVCKGKDFRLHDGWNYIGRDSALDVCIDDPKISRRRMARIAYESRSRTFVVTPCDDTKDITYCCDEPLYATRKLNAFDVLSLGDTNLMFVPLCGEKFAWEE